MDKLQPLITHKFWLLFGLVLLVPIVAWWMTSGSLQAETTLKEGEIKTAEGQVPPLNSPNEKHVAGAREIVDEKEETVVAQIERLWDRQQQLMTWPRGMQSEMEQYEYRDEINSDYRLRYRVQYEAERQRVESVVKPFKVNALTGAEEGLVQLEQMPFVDSRQLWASRPPTSRAMWDAQEDIWLTESVLEAIAEVNSRTEAGKTPTVVSEVPIPLVKLLMFKGGRRGEPGAVASSNSSASGANSGTPVGGGLNLFGSSGSGGSGYGGPNSGSSSSDYGSGGSSGGGSGSSSAAFDPTKVFGDATLGPADAAASPAEAPSIGLLGGTRGGNAKAERRYIEDDPTLPYRTRGFYLQVTMRNEFVPDLMLALSNMDWPTSVSHVHMVELHADEVEYVEDGNSRRGSSSASYATGRSGPRSLGASRSRTPPRSLARPMSTGSNGAYEGGSGMGGIGGNNLLTAALANRAMADVVIAGVITIYTPPTLESSGASPGETTPGVTGEDDPAADTTENPDAPIDPSATDPAATDPAVTDPATNAPADTAPTGDPAADANSPTDTTNDPLPPDDSAGTSPEPEASNPEDSTATDTPESPTVP